jgi:pentatricopeptide repeat protein
MSWLCFNPQSMAFEVIVTVLILSFSWLLHTQRSRTKRGKVAGKLQGARSPWTGSSTSKISEGAKNQIVSLPRKASAKKDGAGGRTKPIEASDDSTILITAVWKGRMAEIPQLMDAALERSAMRVGNDPEAAEAAFREHFLQVLRTCASAQRFAGALQLYDHIKAQIGAGCHNTWSLLLYNSVESGNLKRGQEFYSKLLLISSPSGHDLINIVRCLANVQDLPGLRCVLSDPRLAGAQLDAHIRNRALAACCYEGALELAKAVAASDAFAEPMDVAGYNTIMKGYGKSGKLSRCLQLKEEMYASGLEASEMTFGILLEACIHGGEFDQAMSICKELRGKGLALNKIHITTIIKGLASSGQLRKAEAMLDDMSESLNIRPDVVTYQTLIKAYLAHSDIAAALRLFENMQKQGIQPDMVMVESMFMGCCSKGLRPAETMHVLGVLAGHGVSPTKRALTLVVKSLAQNQAWQATLDLLADLPGRFGIQPEAHLYAQLGLACIKTDNMRMAADIKEAMLKLDGGAANNIDRFASCRLFMHCSACEPSEAKAVAFGSQVEAPLRTSSMTTRLPLQKEDAPSSPTAARLMQFIGVNNLKASCANVLLGLPTPQAEWVMDEGFLVHDKAESSNLRGEEVVLGRLGAMKELSKNWGRYPEAPDIQKRLDNFIEINSLDRRCVETLCNLSSAQKLWVMNQEFLVSVDPARGTAAAKVVSLVWKVWQEAKSNAELRALGPHNHPLGAAAVACALDDYISVNQLDVRCARLLRSLSYAEVAWVMDQEFVVAVDHAKGSASSKVVGLIIKLRSQNSSARQY